MKSKVLIALLHLLVLPLAASAAPDAPQATDRYAGPNWVFLDPGTILAAARDITPASYPDCDEATVEKKMMRVYHPDGTAEVQDESFVKVLTEKGKRSNRTLTLSFMLPYETAEVVKLELIKPDGTVVPVEVAANSKETTDDSQMRINVYDPNSRLLRVSIPQLEIGDVVHAITRQPILRPYMPGEFADANVLEGDGYIRHLSYEVQAPEERPLKFAVLRDEVAGTVQPSAHPGEGHTQIHHWEVSNVPRVFAEPSMPPYEMVLQRLLVSTTPDWRAVSKWYWELSRGHLEATTPALKQTVAELTADAQTDEARIKALFYYVSKKVRYMGLTPEKDRPGYEPHDVGVTFEKQYGVCRDKAALLVSMLRAAGFHAYPVLINLGSKRDPEVPDTDFNHAIVGVELNAGAYLLMDPTDENTRELLPASDCDQSYLVCRPEGEDLKVSPVQPPEDHLMRVKTTGVLSADGRLQAKSDLSFDGVNDDVYRNMFSRMKPDEIRRFFERNLKQTVPGARLRSFNLTPVDMVDVSKPLHAALEFSVESMTAAGQGKAVVAVPWIGQQLGMINFILGDAGLEKRQYPMQTYAACGIIEEIALSLAREYSTAVSTPTCPPVDDGTLSYRRSYDFTNGTLNCARELKLKVVEFSPTQYLKLRQTLKALEYDERKAPVLALVPGAAGESVALADSGTEAAVESNAETLASDKELRVTDAHSAVYRVQYRKRILSYAGKIREAEVKIDYNPATQEARLVRGVVTSKTGQRQEISPDEMNVMDASWNASAKRYTGGKILVANLPGVDIGSILEVEYEITSKGRAFLAGRESFQLQDELDQKTFRLTAPPGLKISKRVSGSPSMVREDDTGEGAQQSFQWRAEHVPALPAEYQLPPEWFYSAGVDYFVGDLNSYWNELYDTMLDRSRQSSHAAALARQIASRSASRLESLKSVRDYVAQSIRAAGPDFTDLPLSELSAADTTLADGYGHAADCAILLHAMLTAAGFHPEFVLASSLPSIKSLTDVAKNFPLPGLFRRMLVKVNLEGESYYLNDTDQYARLGSTPDDGRLGLVLSRRSYEVIRSAKECGDKTEMAYRLTVDDSGKTRVTVVQNYYGTDFNAMNKFFSELPPEERRRYYQELVSDVAQGAVPVGDLTTRFDSYPGLEQFTVDIDNYGVVDGRYLYFDLPFRSFLLPVGSDRRTLPLMISRSSRRVIRTVIDLPAGFRQVVMAPKGERLEEPDRAGQARITASEGSGKYVMTEEFETAPAIIPPRDYSATLEIESKLGRKSAKVFLLERN